MWISGKINVARNISSEELLKMFPEHEVSLEDGVVVIRTTKIPFFAEHQLFLNIKNHHLHYRLSIPAMWPFIAFMFLSVVFLAGLNNWEMMVVGFLIVTGISFAVYVINDKGTRRYIQKYLSDILIDEFDSKISPTKSEKENHTGTLDTTIQYHFRK